MITLTLPHATPSQNVYQRYHWHRQHKLLNSYRMLIRAGLNKLGLFGAAPPEHRVSVTIRRYCAGHLDRGNFIGGCKPLLDALKHEGVIRDDTETWLDDRYEQHEARRCEARTEIEIDGLDDMRVARDARADGAVMV